MNEMIYNPLEEFEGKLSSLHSEKTDAFFADLVARSGVDAEENRKTVQLLSEEKDSLAKLKKRLNRWRVLRVLMIITILLIPVVILKTTPKIRLMRSDIEKMNEHTDELLAKAYEQMRPLNELFSDRDALLLVHETMPLAEFDDYFSAEKEEDMKQNFDFCDFGKTDESALDVISGSYNENPFIFCNKLIHTMGTEVYHGYRTVSWTESYIDAGGKRQRRTKTETLHATLTKPKPFYSRRVILCYGAQAGADLSFTRDATGLNKKSEKELERYVKKGEKRLKKLTDDALKDNREFMSMSNSEFEVLFDALDRTNEVQFRALFTPLAQTNMVDLILSNTGFGDDFSFVKSNRMNEISTLHSCGRKINLYPEDYISYSFDEISENFKSKNKTFFKDVFFDFAPILAIPAYQERPVHSLKPISDYKMKYSSHECEAMANAVDKSKLTHPNTKTEAIIKSRFVASDNKGEEISVTAYSYDIEKRTDYVRMRAGNGKFYDVPVNWDEYIPLEQENALFVTEGDFEDGSVLAKRNRLCIFNKN